MAKQMIMVLDTETCDLEGNVYDVGFVIADRTGHIYARYNALVRETFTDAEKMMGAFYARKIFTHYAPMLNDGLIALRPWAEIADEVRRTAEDYNVQTVAAYNLGFDERVLRKMGQQFGTAPLFRDGIQELDLWQFACEVRLNKATYRKIALHHGWVSPKGNIRTGAEYAYRFVTGDYGFIEDHTALSDAEIEAEIMAECFKHKRRVPYGVVNNHPWRIVQRMAA
jgi:hypothetical protein